jgi:hypothetical protein
MECPRTVLPAPPRRTEEVADDDIDSLRYIQGSPSTHLV